MHTIGAGHGGDPFEWRPQPAAAAIVRSLLRRFLGRSSAARTLARRMREETGTRLVDWLDHIEIPAADADEAGWMAAGFRRTEVEGRRCFVHDGGIFPVLIAGGESAFRLAIGVDSAADFAAVHRLAEPDGAPCSSYRRVRASREDGTELLAVERHGYAGFSPELAPSPAPRAVVWHAAALRCRRRRFENELDGFEELNRVLHDARSDLGRDRACDMFFTAEREYWQRRNRAGRVQHARQAALGLGWGNDDHHTYRSSRHAFGALIRVLESLGLSCRERFHAGADAGWGAQVLESAATGVVVFADVDLSPDELRDDFSHAGLEPRRELGTVGLWCALHGESIIEAGMHHLECTFDHSLLRDQLEELGVGMMPPFTALAHLRQAFTEGEIWPVERRRLARLFRQGLLSEEEAVHFALSGAVGSHLENLERNDGYKGFNQRGVSSVIEETDPRRLARIR